MNLGLQGLAQVCVCVCVVGSIRSLIQTNFASYSTLFFTFVFSSVFPYWYWLSLCDLNVGQTRHYWPKSRIFNTRRQSNCVITMTASNINFHSWVIKLQINQANRVVAFAITGPGCNVSSARSEPAPASFQRSTAAVWKQSPRVLNEGLNSSQQCNINWGCGPPEDSGFLILASIGHIEWKESRPFLKQTIRLKVHHCPQLYARGNTKIHKSVKLKIASSGFRIVDILYCLPESINFFW